MADFITAEQRADLVKLYIAYFNRAPEADGLNFHAAKLLADINSGMTAAQALTARADAFYADALTLGAWTGYTAAMTAEDFVKKVYANVLLRPGEGGDAPTDAEVAYWVTELANGSVTRGSIITQFLADQKTLAEHGTAEEKAATAKVTAVLDARLEVALEFSKMEISGELRGEAAHDAGVAALAGVKDAATAAAKIAELAGQVNAGETYTLTTGIDAGPEFTGTVGNDTFNATETAAGGRVLGGLDVIDGGDGVDTLNVDNSQAAAPFTFGGATIKNVEIINVSTNGNFNGLDISGIAGLATFNGTAADTAATTLTAANTTAVNLTLATTANSTVTGGSSVSVTKGAAAIGTLGVTGKGLTDVTIKGGAGVVTINNQEDSVAATANKGTTLKTVTLDGVDANTGIGGEGLESVTVKGATTAARTVTITNAKANHELTLNVDGTGYKADGTAAQTIVADAAAKTITVNATGAKSSLALTGSTAATTVNILGSADLVLNPLASATKIDGSQATGGLTLGSLNAATVNVVTGSGKDSLTLNATAKAAVDTGAGNDVVTLGSALAAGSTINLGAGDDKLLVSGGSVAVSTATAVTVIDGGDGVDAVAAQLINAGNAAQFKNFELLNLDSTTGLDLQLLAANNTLTGLTISGASTSALYQNVSKDLGLTVDYVGNNSAVTNTLSFKDASGSADAFAIKFGADNSAGTAPTAANVKAGTLAAAGIEEFTIESGGTKAWNEIKLTGANAKTVSITGDANLDLTFASFGTAGANGVSLIDGSAAAGKLSINIAGVGAANSGLTVKGGSAADTITASTFASTLTGGAGADTFDVKAAVVGTATPAGIVLTTITDAAAGDIISFANQGTEVFNATKVNVDTATALIGGTTNALDLAIAAADSTTNGQITWFQYAGDTYLVQELGADAAAIGTDDIVVKLVGLVDLSTATYDAATNGLTFA